MLETRRSRVCLASIVVGLIVAGLLAAAPLLNHYHSYSESAKLMWETIGWIGGVSTAILIMVVIGAFILEWIDRGKL